MDMQEDTSSSLAYVPADQVTLYAAQGSSEGSERRELRALQEYLSENLLQGTPAELRDRIGIILRDERYHELSSKLGATVTHTALMEMLDELEGADEEHPPERLPPSLQPGYARVFELQAYALRCHMAWEGRRPKRTRRRRVERLGFMRENMPSAVKRALLAMWIAPMCHIAILCDGVPEAMRAAVLDEWTDSLERQLALFLALGVDVSMPEDVLPLEKRLRLAQVYGEWMQGYGRTLVELDKKESLLKSQPTESLPG